MTGIRISKRLLVVTIAMSVIILLAFRYTHRSAAEYFRKTNLHIAHDSNAAPVTNPNFEEDQGNVVSGKEFSGDVLRQFPLQKRLFHGYRDVPRDPDSSSTHHCERWAVSTTIFEPTEAVRRLTHLPGWCLVVVADKRSPESYETGWVAGGNGEGNDRVVYLTTELQEAMRNEFVSSIPWNHFGRKNVGYLYAMKKGASVIWDYDDDNMLKYWIKDAATSNSMSIDNIIDEINRSEKITVSQPTSPNLNVYNPYPVLGAPTLPSWPRGLPLEVIKKPEYSNNTLLETEMNAKSIGVLQSLADYQPDVDAIYRITQPVPFWFQRSKESRHLMIPEGTLTPYNAQATLHFKPAFFALFLPMTVHSRVSDIWRSYFAQRLFWDADIRFGFMPRPIVVQDRNLHSNLGDLNAEQHLYMRSSKLVDFLNEWFGMGDTLVERMEELYIALYEHDYIELDDVYSLQLWLKNLIDAGYDFPSITDTFIHEPTEHKRGKVDKIDDDLHCEPKQSLTFWTSDLHDGSRIDMPSTLASSSLNQKVIVAGHKGTNSPYPLVWKMKGISTYNKKLSSVIAKEFLTHSQYITEDMVKRNFEFFKTDPQIKEVDAFFCSFTAAMCELWMPFNKTIVYLPCHRYNLGRCTEESWKRLDEHLRILSTMDSPKHVIAAASAYDYEYMRHYTGFQPILLPSYGGFYTTNNPYNPTKDTIIVFGLSGWDFDSKVKKFKLIDVRKQYSHYTLSDLTSHRAIVYMPHSVMSYTLTELYSLTVPLFIPSMKFLQTLKPLGPDRSSLSAYYCKNPGLDEKVKPHPSTLHPYSPNVEAEVDPEAEYYWMQFADFFHWPHIVHFDDLEDLEAKLDKADFEALHNLMVKEMKRKEGELISNWCKVINKIDSGREVPQDYQKAIKVLYNVTSLQV